MTRLIFLGTAAALPRADRANTMLALLGEDSAPGVLIDCGSGVYDALLRASLGPDAIGDLFITHAHIDHIGGLPSLIESFRLGGRQTPLRIWAIPEVLDIARRIVEVFSYELTLESWSFPVSFREIEEGQSVMLGGFPARVARMDHTVPSAGVRLELPGGSLAYTCDTQPNPAIAPFGAGARLFITESTFPHRAVAAARHSKHLTAHEAGQQAAACGAERLALVHLGVGESFSAEDARAEAAQTFAGEVIVPRDGDALDL